MAALDRFLRSVAAAFAAAVALGGAPACQGPSTDWNSVFHRRDGWLYADGGSSAELPDGRTVWLFGDTFLRRERGLVSNSIAIQETGSGHAPRYDEIRFFARDAEAHLLDVSRRTEDGMRPWLEPAPRGDGKAPWLWPTDAIVSGGRLIAFYTEIVCVHGEVPACRSYLGNMGITGHSVMTVDEPTGAPDRWQVRRTVLADRAGVPPVARQLLWGSALVEEEGWLYVFGAVQEENGLHAETKLARVLPANVEHYERWQFLTTTGWRIAPTGVRPSELETVAFESSTMLSVTPVERDGERLYLMLHTTPFSDEVVVQTARAPELGAARFLSSAGGIVRHVPVADLDPAAAEGRSWAGRAQRGFRRADDTLVVSYFSTKTASLRFAELPLSRVFAAP